MPRYSEGMKAAWARKTPKERSERGRALAHRRWGIKNKIKNSMDFTMKLNGVEYSYSAESQTFVITASDSVVTLGLPTEVTAPAPAVEEVKVEESDGSEEVMVPEAAEGSEVAT